MFSNKQQTAERVRMHVCVQPAHKSLLVRLGTCVFGINLFVCVVASHECVSLKCVGCNQTQILTTQQPVQRPVCIITACPAARDRQTRLRSSELQNTDLPPHRRNPCGRAKPSTAAQKWTNRRLQIDKLSGMRGRLIHVKNIQLS